jgi:hypothetical protein
VGISLVKAGWRKKGAGVNDSRNRKSRKKMYGRKIGR